MIFRSFLSLILAASAYAADPSPAPILPPLAGTPTDASFALVERLSKQHEFHCTKVRDAGSLCVGDAIDYPLQVAIVVPENYRPSGKYIVHMHGFILGNSIDSTFGAILDYFNFNNLIKQAGVSDQLLIIPHSTGQCSTFVSADGIGPRFDQFMASVREVIGETMPVQSITISGHSGAYMPIRQILVRSSKGTYGPRIQNVMLFDATYGGDGFSTGPYEDWRARGHDRGIYSVYRPGTATQEGSRTLKADLHLTDDDVYPTNNATHPGSDNHWGTVRAYYAELLRKTL